MSITRRQGQSKLGLPPTEATGAPTRKFFRHYLYQTTLSPSRRIYFVKQLLGRKYDHESDVAGLPSGHCRPYISNREPYYKLSSGKTVVSTVGALVLPQAANIFLRKTPEQIYVTILTELKRIIQDRFPLKKVIKAVFTVPATATDEYRRIVKQSAGKNGAGFDEVYLLSEPSAAVVAFHVEVGSGDGQNVTIIDIRGDTTEVSISAFRNSELEVLAKTSKEIGGINIEHAIVDYVLQQLDQLNADDALRNRIRIAWLKVKNELVKKGNTRIAVEGFNPIPLTIDKFNALNADNFDKIVATVQYAMDSISMDVGQVNEVALIGSLSRVPRIVELVEQYFKKKIIDKLVVIVF